MTIPILRHPENGERIFRCAGGMGWFFYDVVMMLQMFKRIQAHVVNLPTAIPGF